MEKFKKTIEKSETCQNLIDIWRVLRHLQYNISDNMDKSIYDVRASEPYHGGTEPPIKVKVFGSFYTTPNLIASNFEAIKKESGDNGFVMTPKRWIEVTGAVGIVSKQGRYAATYAHRDIAFDFCRRV